MEARSCPFRSIPVSKRTRLPYQTFEKSSKTALSLL